MIMRIETWFRTRSIDDPPRELRKLSADFLDYRHGWQTPEDFVRECSKRFKHRNPRPYKNGLEMDGDVGTIERISFE